MGRARVGPEVVEYRARRPRLRGSLHDRTTRRRTTGPPLYVRTRARRFPGPALDARKTSFPRIPPALEEASNTHSLAATRELTLRREWIRNYRATYGGLTAQIPDNRKQVEGYFRGRLSHDRRPAEAKPA